MNFNIKHITILVLALLITMPAFSQRRVELLNADEFEGGRSEGRRYDKFIGNVHFIQGSIEIWCDSAYLYKKENSLEALGHVRIFDLVDSVNITADKLIYDSDERFANLRENVVYREDSLILRTDHLDYDIFTRSAIYYNGGKIVDGENILTSKRGYYDSQSRIMSFRKDVVFKNPENTLKTDSLVYNMNTEIATTFGPTDIIASDGSIINSEEGGVFDMKVNTTTITAGEIETESYIIRGEELFYDRRTGSNNARGNVYMFSKKENIIITGDAADNIKEEGITQIYGNPLMKKVFEGDTLYLSADTLISIDDSLDAKKRLLAFNNVRFYRIDLQGKSDSLAYFLSDSTLHLYDDPVLWSEGNQIEADSINILFEDEQISRMNLKNNSFMVLQDTLGNFNQLKGKNMTGFFAENKIQRLDVIGNSESLFYALDEKDNSLTGINRTLCSNMRIRFKENRAQNISFYVDVEATFIPPHEIKEPDTRLKGFTWRELERPVLKNMLEKPVTQEELSENIPPREEAEQIEALEQ